MKFVRVSPTAKIPTYGSQGAAGADLYVDSQEAISIGIGETAVVHTGIAVAIPKGYVGLIFARSGLATKRGLEPQERVAKLVIVPFLPVEYEEAETLDETERGDGGFGSTGRL